MEPRHKLRSVAWMRVAGGRFGCSRRAGKLIRLTGNGRGRQAGRATQRPASAWAFSLPCPGRAVLVPDP